MKNLIRSFAARRVNFGWRLVCLVLCVSLLAPVSLASASPDEGAFPGYAWHTFLGSADTDFGFGLAVDGENNLYIVGASEDDWDGPAGEDPLHPYADNADLFVLKLDPDGNYLWHTFYGSTADDEARQVAVDSQGNVYVAAFSYATWQGEDDTDPLVDFHGSIEAALLKLDKDGAYQWHAFYGVAVTEELGFGVTLDSNEDPTFVLFSNGSWNGPEDQLPLHTFTAGGTNLAALKLSSAGLYQWHTFYPGSPALGLDYDTQDNLLIAGTSYAAWTGPAGEDPVNPWTGQGDVMVIKLDSSGGYLWHTFHGSTVGDFAYDVQVDSLGNVVVAGFCSATWDGPADEDPLNTFTGPFDMVALKLDPDGAYQWHTFYGSDVNDLSLSLAVDDEDGVSLLGHSAKTWSGPAGEDPLYAYTADTDLAVVSLTDAGEYSWHTFFGSDKADNGESIAFDAQGDLYIVGGSRASWLVDPAVPPLHDHTAGNYDMVLVKMEYPQAAWEVFLPVINN